MDIAKPAGELRNAWVAPGHRHEGLLVDETLGDP